MNTKSGAARSAPASPTEGMKALPLLLGFTAGFVDAIGYLALQGLFTAHVTGNFVTLGASLVFGTSGVLGKVLALPVFCLVIVAARLAGNRLRSLGRPVLGLMMLLKLVLLTGAAALALGFGPFASGDTAIELVTGQLLVAAMAIQNAAHRVHLPATPPSTVMTSSTTQAMIDLGDLLYVGVRNAAPALKQRLARTTAIIAFFAAGCAAGALCFARTGIHAFVIPPLLALGTVALVVSARR